MHVSKFSLHFATINLATIHTSLNNLWCFYFYVNFLAVNCNMLKINLLVSHSYGWNMQYAVLKAILIGSKSFEYVTVEEMLAELVDLLAGNAPIISQFTNDAFLSGLIVEATGCTPYERADKIFSSVLATLKFHPNPRRVFSSLITSLKKVGLNDMAFKLIENLRIKGGHIDHNPEHYHTEQLSSSSEFEVASNIKNVYAQEKFGIKSRAFKLMDKLRIRRSRNYPKLEQQPLVSKQPIQSVDVTAQSHTSGLMAITESQSSTPTTVIELCSKSEVATNIGSLHCHFVSLDTNIRDEFKKLVKNEKVELKAVASSAAAYLSIEVTTLRYSDQVDELFDSLQAHYDFLNCGLLKHLTDTFLSIAQTELTQYIDSVDKISESSQLKHIWSAIKENSSLSEAASPTTNYQTKLINVKLSDRWKEMTLSTLKAVLKYYFGVMSDLFSHASFDYGSFVVTFLLPASQSQSLVDIIIDKTNSMSRLGILEVVVDNTIIPMRKEDNTASFNASLHQSVILGASFEVSILLQLGADPNSKNEKGKSAVEIAIEEGHTHVKFFWRVS
ncbi:PREDICTED: uncharacterized protein LOC109581800 [Amphimedon queenslandica]|uniref:Uncharacterized protein n=1 Tax=Amphimedon queenslandica TaxID=400682 RepID=A0AAN0J435_AMPQE|nr:PREDICTED: uncharacterized protein LOC109581800 [Amphimedon queenslandica]|eukprot:XP_019851760.1 PREDICTED: uncharacterized protein LOC109581800 [Amphimedon queenslandica]